MSEYMSKVLKVHGLTGAQTLAAHLGLSSPSNLQKSPESPKRLRRGLRGISSAGRNLVRDAALYLEETYGRQTLSFLTLTIPTECLTPSLFLGWSDLTRKLRQRLVYALKEHELDPSVVGVVEIQELRQSDCAGMPALHWHLLFQGRKKGHTWALPPKWFASTWNDLLWKASGVRPQSQAATRVESVRSSASGYLGKYMSKGSQALLSVNTDYVPSSWYMCTRPLLRIVNRLIVYATGIKATQVYDFLMNNKGWLRYSKDIQLETDAGGLITIGWYGDLTNRETYRDFLWKAGEILKPESERIPFPV